MSQRKLEQIPFLAGSSALSSGHQYVARRTHKTSGLSSHVVTVTRRSNGVKTDGVGLSVLLAVTRGDNTPGLSFPVRKVTIVVNDDVACLSSCLGSDDALSGDDLSSERSLVLVHIDRDSRLIIVRLGLQKVLLSSQSGTDLQGQRRVSEHGETERRQVLFLGQHQFK